MDLGMAFTADAIEHSEIVEANGELRFTTPREFSIAMKEADINQAVRQIIGKPLKIKVTIGEVAAQNQEKGRGRARRAAGRRCVAPRARESGSAELSGFVRRRGPHGSQPKGVAT
jgi:hypothetical protein